MRLLTPLLDPLHLAWQSLDASERDLGISALEFLLEAERRLGVLPIANRPTKKTLVVHQRRDSVTRTELLTALDCPALSAGSAARWTRLEPL